MTHEASTPPPYRVLFVCMGNICRSPLAEAIFLQLCRERALDGRFHVDSAGTGSWHVGERADPRTLEVASRHGVSVESIGRQVEPDDFETFDLILAMDRQNLRHLRANCPVASRHKLRLMTDYDAEGQRGGDVPDPYYGGADGFDDLYAQLAVCCQNLLAALTTDDR